MATPSKLTAIGTATSRRPHRTPKKTFRIYFRGVEYGVTKLDYKLFADNDAVSKFDRILLRGGGNRSYPYFDFSQRREADYINDEFARRIRADIPKWAKVIQTANIRVD